jgi:hypothetical protein
VSGFFLSSDGGHLSEVFSRFNVACQWVALLLFAVGVGVKISTSISM